MISHLQMITLFVADLDRSLAFYVNKLGFVELSTFDDGVDSVWCGLCLKLRGGINTRPR